jgi:peptidoglycan/LPS O-acetylase OafA/YrhL
MTPPTRHRAESAGRLLILLAIGGMAGAAAFTHVHDLTVTHGQPDWIGWANAVAVELMATYLGLEIRARRRTGRPVGLVGVLLVGFALLSLSAQVAEAERSVWGWIVAAVPSLAFLALVKVVLSSAPAVDHDMASVPDPEPISSSPHGPARRASAAVLPPLGVVHPHRPIPAEVSR